MFLKPVVNNNGHRPIDNSSKLTPQSIPVSEEPGNQLTVAEDGLYVGVLNDTPVRIYVDSAIGVDDEDHGSLGSPVKTLDYALEALHTRDLTGSGLFRIGATYEVMLKAGQSFTLMEKREIKGITLRLCFYGDALGDWDTQVANTAAEVLSAVARPAIANRFTMNPETGLTEASRIFTRDRRWPSSVEFHGIRLNLAETSASNLGVVDFIDGPDLSLVGTIVNKSGLGPAGLLAVRADQHSVLRQFASQFMIEGTLINKPQGQDGITFAQLEARALFLKFYLGLGGSNYRWDLLTYNPEALNSSNASGLLDLLWEDSISQPVASTTTMASYPHMSDLNFGVARYFTGLRRDQLGRSMNVLAGRII